MNASAFSTRLALCILAIACAAHAQTSSATAQKQSGAAAAESKPVPATPQVAPARPHVPASATHSQVTADPAVAPLAPSTHPKTLQPRTESDNSNLIVLDPGHGGLDNGAMFPAEYGKPVVEKDVTLALANRIADHLRGQGFTVILTRTNSDDNVPEEARIELANRAHPLACLLLHAANGGHGVHVYASGLTQQFGAPDPNALVPWDAAQASVLAQSLRLSADLSNALGGIRVPLVTGRASVAPIDSLTCAAVALEIAPIGSSGDANTPVTDPMYQTHVAEAVTNAMGSWRAKVRSVTAAAQATAQAQKPTTSGKTAQGESNSKPRTATKTKPAPLPGATGSPQ